MKVTALISTDNGDCKLVHGAIACKLALRPPTCTCKGDGGTVKLDFTAEFDRRLVRTGATYGAEGFINVTSVTPVPYIIPSNPTQEPSANADLPICKQGQPSTREKPCIQHG
jgi:hypothetical protein